MTGAQRQRRRDGDGRSLSWFRHWCGLSTDPKFAGVAARTGQPLERVVYIFVHMLESAAHQNAGGAFEIDPEALAYILRAPVDDLRALLQAFEAAGLTKAGVVSNWLKRQPPSDHDPTATERQQRHRANLREGNRVASAVVTRDMSVTSGDEASQSRSPESRAAEDRTQKAAAVGDRIEFRKRCEEAAGAENLPDFEAIVQLAADGYDVERRILPMIRTVAAGLRKRAQPAGSWRYFVPPIRDEDRSPSPETMAEPQENLDEQSPEFQEANRILTERGKKPKRAHGTRDGRKAQFPSELVAEARRRVRADGWSRTGDGSSLGAELRSNRG